MKIMVHQPKKELKMKNTTVAERVSKLAMDNYVLEIYGEKGEIFREELAQELTEMTEEIVSECLRTVNREMFRMGIDRHDDWDENQKEEYVEVCSLFLSRVSQGLNKLSVEQPIVTRVSSLLHNRTEQLASYQGALSERYLDEAGEEAAAGTDDYVRFLESHRSSLIKDRKEGSHDE